MSSEEDGAQLMAAFKKKSKREPSAVVHPTFTPRRAASDALPPAPIAFTPVNRPAPKRELISVRVSPVRDRQQYEYYAPEDEVEEIVREYVKQGEMMYEVRLVGGKSRQVSQTRRQVRETWVMERLWRRNYGLYLSRRFHQESPTSHIASL